MCVCIYIHIKGDISDTIGMMQGFSGRIPYAMFREDLEIVQEVSGHNSAYSNRDPLKGTSKHSDYSCMLIDTYISYICETQGLGI